MLVKKYARSSADTDVAEPAFLRPPFVLHKTVDYLLDRVLRANWPAAARRFALYCFLQDRLRAVRQDFTVAFSLSGDFCALPETIRSYELMVRFYLAVLNPMRAHADFDEKLWAEGFVQALETLCQGYLRAATRARELNDGGDAFFYASPARVAHLRFHFFIKAFEEPLVFFNTLLQFRLCFPRVLEEPAAAEVLRLADALEAGAYQVYFRAICDAQPLFAALLSHKDFVTRARVDYARCLRAADPRASEARQLFEQSELLFGSAREHAVFCRWMRDNGLEGEDVSPRPFIPKLRLGPLRVLTQRLAPKSIPDWVLDEEGESPAAEPHLRPPILERKQQTPAVSGRGDAGSTPTNAEAERPPPIDPRLNAACRLARTLSHMLKRDTLRFWHETTTVELRRLFLQLRQFSRCRRTALHRRVLAAFRHLVDQKRQKKGIWERLSPAQPSTPIFSLNSRSFDAVLGDQTIYQALSPVVARIHASAPLYEENGIAVFRLQLITVNNTRPEILQRFISRAFGVALSALPLRRTAFHAQVTFILEVFALKSAEQVARTHADIRWFISDGEPTAEQQSDIFALQAADADPRQVTRGLRSWLRGSFADSILIIIRPSGTTFASLRSLTRLKCLAAEATRKTVGELLLQLSLAHFAAQSLLLQELKTKAPSLGLFPKAHIAEVLSEAIAALSDSHAPTLHYKSALFSTLRRLEYTKKLKQILEECNCASQEIKAAFKDSLLSNMPDELFAGLDLNFNSDEAMRCVCGVMREFCGLSSAAQRVRKATLLATLHNLNRAVNFTNAIAHMPAVILYTSPMEIVEELSRGSVEEEVESAFRRLSFIGAEHARDRLRKQQNFSAALPFERGEATLLQKRSSLSGSEAGSRTLAHFGDLV